jgi:transcriptional regulator with XRE-family HTH domain
MLKLKIVEHFGTADNLARILRKEYGMRIDSSAISRIKNGFRDPTPEQRNVLAKALQTPVDELFDA